MRRAVFGYTRAQRSGRLHVPNRGFLLACGRGTEGWGAPPRVSPASSCTVPGLTSMCNLMAKGIIIIFPRGKFELEANSFFVTETRRGHLASGLFPRPFRHAQGPARPINHEVLGQQL